MDSRVVERLDIKMAESQESADEIKRLAESIATPPRSAEDVLLGIVAGRLYNSFRYQSRRILGRDPLPEEFDEFVDRVSGNAESLLGVSGAGARQSRQAA